VDIGVLLLGKREHAGLSVMRGLAARILVMAKQ